MAGIREVNGPRAGDLHDHVFPSLEFGFQVRVGHYVSVPQTKPYRQVQLVLMGWCWFVNGGQVPSTSCNPTVAKATTHRPSELAEIRPRKIQRCGPQR